MPSETLFQTHPQAMTRLLSCLLKERPANALLDLVKGAGAVAQGTVDGSGFDQRSLPASINPQAIRALAALVKENPDHPVSLAVSDVCLAANMVNENPEAAEQFVKEHEHSSPAVDSDMGLVQLAHIFWPGTNYYQVLGLPLGKGQTPTSGCLGNPSSRHILLGFGQPEKADPNARYGQPGWEEVS